jgi:nitroreductase
MILTVWHEYPTGEDDACIASTIIQLKAHELGLGSCWLQTKGKFDANGKPCHDNIREILEIPEDIYISNLISLGYPAEERPAYTEKDMDMSKVHYNKW